ncbi:MAG: hypothetical protein WC980_03895 [Candidatus Brocadiia bacterium]
MIKCHQYLQKALDIYGQLIILADEGETACSNDECPGCLVLYGIIRDSAYKIRNQAEVEINKHKQQSNKF